MEEGSKATLIQRIQDSLTRANNQVSRLRTTHTALTVVALVAGGLSTLLAGGSAVNRAPLLGAGDAGWGLTCLLAAVLTLAGTAAGGINQQFRIPEMLGQAQSCAGRLAALDVALSVGNAQPGAIAEKYTDILAEYQAVLGR